MSESTSGHAGHKSPVPLPQISECDVSLDQDGTYQVRHKGSGDTASADTAMDAEMKAIVLRVSAALNRELPFTAGDMP